MIDRYGLYVQANGGNGDSAHRTGLAAAILKLTDSKRSDLWYALHAIKNNLEISDGIYIRHPSDYENDWSAFPSNFSRDQASRVILAYAVNGEKDAIKRWLKQMAKRFFFHQNTMDPTTNEKKIPDIMSFGEWRNIIRGLNLWWLYPVLIVLDLFFIGDVYLRKEWDGVSLFVPDLKYALKKFWTPSAWIANKLNDRTPWLEQALNNHDLSNNGCVELQPLFKKLKDI